jgi:N-acetylglucosamine-6-sulfatase
VNRGRNGFRCGAVELSIRRWVNIIAHRYRARYTLLATLQCSVAFFANDRLEPISAQDAQPPARPNIVLVLSDDQDADSLGHMNTLQEQLVEKGTSFSKAFVTVPQCCPSRVSLLRGQYVHNHGVLRNHHGWQSFRNSGKESDTLATWLDGAGYFTGYVGKYLNGYGQRSTTNYIPPGWDRWYRYQGEYNEYYPSYRVNENGKIAVYRHDERNDTDYFRDKAEPS